MQPQAFVQKWRDVQVKEKSGYQEHFFDLCALLGAKTPIQEDPKGTFYLFEAGATKQSGGQGWADVWRKGCFAMEYKGVGANLTKAYEQLLQYRESLQNPPLLIVSDMQRMIVHTNFTNTVKRTVEFTLDDLLKPDKLAYLKQIFTNPEAFKAQTTTEQVTKEAAAEFAKLAQLLARYEKDKTPHEIAHFLIRVLFCLFAEDVELLPKGMFSRLVKQVGHNATAFSAQLRVLFQAMATGGYFGSDAIRHFNGSLFDDDTVIPLGSDALAILQKVSKLDWSSIEPAILGTLFERSLDPNKRSQLGAHYTSKDDILLVVEPVVMQPLRREWADLQGTLNTLDVERVAASPAQQTTITTKMRTLIDAFIYRLHSLKVLDPACGSGNFLYVALKSVLDLEKEVITFGADVGLSYRFPMVSPEQFLGIEVNEYAHELAQITVWIGYIQWLRDNGFGDPSDPILKTLATITNMDAILAFDANGNPIEPVWPQADYIIGNPPFLGGKRLRAELGNDYVDNLFMRYSSHIPRQADFVAYWFERARALIASGLTQRAGFIATQSIRAGASRKILEKINQTGSIFYAQADRPWILDGAAVRVSMVAFDGGQEQEKRLNTNKDDVSSLAYINTKPVSQIHSDLTEGADITSAVVLNENKHISFQGVIKVGPFDIDAQTAMRLQSASGNPHGKPNKDVIKRWMIADDITNRPRDMWIIDFGTTMSHDEASLYEKPFEYVKTHVKPQRDKVNRKTHREIWWRFGDTRPGMRTAIKNNSRYIVTPAVAKHRLFVWVDKDTLVAQRFCVIARDDDYFFGVLHSRIHEVWSLATSSRHGVGNDPTYNNTTCFETFPFPWPPAKEPKDLPLVNAIAEAAKELVEKRDRWLNPAGASEAELKKRTLTNLYNEHPTWLDLAHKKLDLPPMGGRTR